MSEQTQKMEVFMIAKQAADLAVLELSQKMREDFREELKTLRLEIKEDFRAEMQEKFEQHFGEMKPSNHTTQHARIEKLLASCDRITESIVGNIVRTLLIVALLVGAFGFGIFDKLAKLGQ